MCFIIELCAFSQHRQTQNTALDYNSSVSTLKRHFAWQFHKPKHEYIVYGTNIGFTLQDYIAYDIRLLVVYLRAHKVYNLVIRFLVIVQ